MHTTNNNLRFSGIGTKDGKPAIQWSRYGVAALGEPAIVSVLTTYPDVQSRDAAVPAFS